MTGATFSFPVRIYYEDTDHGGVVYHANYLKYLERARTEYLRAIGLELDAVEQEYGILFALTEAHLSFRKPARFNDLLVVESSLTALSGARIRFAQRIYRQQPRSLLLEAEIHLAGIDRNGNVRRIPKALSDTLRAYRLPKENP